MMKPIHFSNMQTIVGRSRGRAIGTPTINLDFSLLPDDFQHGIYACWITLGEKKFAGAMHYGPRPVFQDDVALEVHVLDALIEHVPATVDLEIAERIRDVQNFPSVQALQAAIASDIDAARGILRAA